MATRVGLLDSDSDDTDVDDDTPLGVGVARRRVKSSLVDGDDTAEDMLEDTERASDDDDDGDDDGLTAAAADALRAHEDTLRAMRRDRADAFGAFLSVDGDTTADARMDSNEEDAEIVPPRPRAPPYRAAVEVAMRARMSSSTLTRANAPVTQETTSGAVDAYAASAGTRGASFAPTGTFAVPAGEGGRVVTGCVRSKASLDVLLGALRVSLEQAVVRAEGGLRQTCSRESTAGKPHGVAAACLRHLEAVVETLANDAEGDGDARERAAAEVSAWALVSELFAEDKGGAARGTAAEVHRRRAGVSAWLREQVARVEPREEDLRGRNAALTHVAGGRTVSATRAAAAHGDPRLATCLAQIGSSKNVAFYAKQQLTRWRTGSVGKYIDEHSEAAFKLLAGEVERDDDGMGWYQNLGLHMWLASGPTAPLRDVVQRYLDAVARQRAANPSPPIASYDTLENNQATHLRDVAFNILALAATTEGEDASPSVEEARVAFHPLTYSDDVLNASLAWHLFTMMNAIGAIDGDGMDALADEITVAFATQLLGMRERACCEWAVFVSQHLRDSARRTKTTGHILRERFNDWNGDDAKIAFIKDACAVPQETLDEARALWDAYATPRP
jgi:nuclear pore complex protein Nup98-Nup96